MPGPEETPGRDIVRAITSPGETPKTGLDVLRLAYRLVQNQHVGGIRENLRQIDELLAAGDLDAALAFTQQMVSPDRAIGNAKAIMHEAEESISRLRGTLGVEDVPIDKQPPDDPSVTARVRYDRHETHETLTAEIIVDQPPNFSARTVEAEAIASPAALLPPPAPTKPSLPDVESPETSLAPTETSKPVAIRPTLDESARAEDLPQGYLDRLAQFNILPLPFSSEFRKKTDLGPRGERELLLAGRVEGVTKVHATWSQVVRADFRDEKGPTAKITDSNINGGKQALLRAIDRLVKASELPEASRLPHEARVLGYFEAHPIWGSTLPRGEWRAALIGEMSSAEFAKLARLAAEKFVKKVDKTPAVDLENLPSLKDSKGIITDGAALELDQETLRLTPSRLWALSARLCHGNPAVLKEAGVTIEKDDKVPLRSAYQVTSGAKPETDAKVNAVQAEVDRIIEEFASDPDRVFGLNPDPRARFLLNKILPLRDPDKRAAFKRIR